MRVLLFLLFGLVTGAVVGIVLPGRTARGWVTSMVIGAAGSMVGGLLGTALFTAERSGPAFVISILGAMSWLVLYQVILRRAWARLQPDGSRISERRTGGGGRRATDVKVPPPKHVSSRSLSTRSQP